MLPTPAYTYPQARRPSPVFADRPCPPVDPVIQGLRRFESSFSSIEQQDSGTHPFTNAIDNPMVGNTRILGDAVAEFRRAVTRKRLVIEAIMRNLGTGDTAAVNRVANWVRDVAQQTQDPPFVRPARECDAPPLFPRPRRHNRHPSLRPTVAEGYVPCPLRDTALTRPSTPSTAAALTPALALAPTLRTERPAGNLPGIQVTVDKLADIGRLERKFDRAQALPVHSSDRLDMLCGILEALDGMVVHGDRVVRYARRRLLLRVLPALGIDSAAPTPATAATAAALDRIAHLERVFEYIMATPTRTRARQYGLIIAALDDIPSGGAAEVLRARRRLVRRILDALGDRRPAPPFDTVATARALSDIAAIERHVARIASRPPTPSNPYRKALAIQAKNLTAVKIGGVPEVREAAERVRRLIIDALKRTRRVRFAPDTPSLDGQQPRIQSPPPPYGSPVPRRMVGRSPLGPLPPSPTPTSSSRFLEVPRLPMHHAAPARMRGPHHPPSPSGALHSVVYFGQIPVLVFPPRAALLERENGMEHVVPTLVITPPEETAPAAPIARDGAVRVAASSSFVRVASPVESAPSRTPLQLIDGAAPIDTRTTDTLVSSSDSDWEDVEEKADTDSDGFEVV